jgi:hypothetical protein
MLSEKELREYFKLFVDEEGIVHLVILKSEGNPEINIALTRLVKNDLFRVFDRSPQKLYRVLIDLSATGEIRFKFPKEVRKDIAVQIATHKQMKRVAFVIKSVILKTIVDFIITASGRTKQNVRIFTDKEEALAWLKTSI